MTVSTRVRARAADELRLQAARERRSVSEIAGRAIEEYLRVTRFPGILFVTAPDGSREPKLVRGLDVWEYVFIATGYGGDVAKTAEHLQQPEANVRLALAYYRAYPEEVDAHLRYLDEVARDPLRHVPFATIVRV